jgi:hypothetical protein
MANRAGREFTVPELAGAGTGADIGTPALPVFRALVEVPFGASVTVEAQAAGIERQVVELPVLPVQPPVPKSGPEPAFAINQKAYLQDQALGGMDARVAEIAEVSPVRYNPARGWLEQARRMDVTVTWSGSDWGKTMQMAHRYSSPAFASRLSGCVVNPGQLALDDGPALPVGLLVIVPDEWQTNIAPLAEWRRRKGFNVYVRNLTQVGGGQAGTVKAYIQDAYDNWPVPPSFVLLVGDVDRIGCFTGQGADNPPTDLNYSLCAGSDFLPDLDVSRASVADAAQLDSLVAKIVGYEKQALSGGTNWLKRQYLIASADGGYHQITENTHAYVMARLRPLGIVCDSLWLYYGSGTPIVTALDGGRSWVTYSGHGAEDQWAEPPFDNADVHGLTNTDLIPYVQTYACLSGDFASTSYPECFSEAWVRNGRRGAIAHSASSVTSYWTEDDTLERRVFDCLLDSGRTWIMGGLNKAKLMFYQQMGAGGSTRRYFEMYNLMGDGAIDVYTLEPKTLSVTHPQVIPVGSYPLAVTVRFLGAPVTGALVCASAKADTTVFAAAYTNAEGEVILNVLTSAPDSVFVTVTGHDLAPYLGAALALPSSGPYVIYLRSTADDSAGGNHDHIINPGETINLQTWMKNWGNSQASGVRTWMRTTDPKVLLLDSLKHFGTIGAGDSAFAGQPGFGFAVAPSCSNGYCLRFSLVTKDANDSTWSSPLALVVGTDVLAFDGYTADDPPPGGNGNGTIDPGETGDIVASLRNGGLGNAYGVTAVLRSTDARLEVLDSVGTFGDIPADSLGTNGGDRFRVRADVAIPRETQIPCTLVVSSGTQVTKLGFGLGVGTIRATDPIPDGPGTPPRYYAYDITDVTYSECPEFSWVELRGLGTRLALGDDETRVVSLPSGFGPLRYYGQSFSQVSVCGNGWMAPGPTTSAAWENVLLPDGAAPGMIALCWDDLYPPQGGGVWYYHDSVNHRFIVEWESIPYYDARTAFDWYEAIVYDTSVHTETGDNVILTQYLTANGYSANTIGLEDPTSQTGINCLFNGSYHRGAATMVPGMAVKYTTNPPRPRTGAFEAGEAVPVPARLALLGASPNPFRASTMLAYAVPREMRLSLSVYDPSGRRVAVLVNGVQEPGAHFANWRGSDGQGRRCSQGVYFYRLEAEGVSLARKVALVE